MGFLHVQTNPKLAYSTQKIIKNAESELKAQSTFSPSLS